MSMLSPNKKPVKLDADDPRHGATTMPIIGNLVVGGAEMWLWVHCNLQQITTSHDTAYAVIYSSYGPHKSELIASTVAYVTQVVFLLLSFPISRFWGRLHARHGYHPTGSGFQSHASEIYSYLKMRKAIFIIFFVVEVGTDLFYAPPNVKVWVISTMYILALYVGSTVVGLDAFQRLTGALGTCFHSIRYHAKNYPSLPVGQPK